MLGTIDRVSASLRQSRSNGESLGCCGEGGDGIAAEAPISERVVLPLRAQGDDSAGTPRRSRRVRMGRGMCASLPRAPLLHPPLPSLRAASGGYVAAPPPSGGPVGGTERCVGCFGERDSRELHIRIFLNSPRPPTPWAWKTTGNVPICPWHQRHIRAR